MRHVPSTITQALSMTSPKEPIELSRAEHQHETYATLLEHIIPKTVQIPADDRYPDCVFVEDTAVVIDGHAVICRIGAESRRGEVGEMKQALLDLGISVSDMRDDNDVQHATCDGGDVLYPVSYPAANSSTSASTAASTAASASGKRGGKHLFVGISSRTNHAGVNFLQKAFPHVEVVPVELRESEALHLKSIVTHIDEKTLLIPSGEEWDYLCSVMAIEERGYEVVRLPDIKACNVVSMNGNVLAQPNICQESKSILQQEVEEKRGMNMVYVDASEFAKCDGALTCKSILIP